MKIVHLGIAAACLLTVPVSAEILGIGKDKAKATIIDAQGVPIGTATITDSKKKGLSVFISVNGLKRGERAVHLHSVGVCEGPKFVSAGPHWNPGNKMHGFENPDGAHAGDLPNLLVTKKGRATLKYDIPDVRLVKGNGLLDEDGAAIVIHASSDDQRTDPSGNSGDRIACGVIRKD